MTAITALPTNVAANLAKPAAAAASPAASAAPAAPKLDNDGDYDNGAGPAVKVSLSPTAQNILAQK